MIGFDPACTFLLAMPFENLFEPARADDPDDLVWRCKGCGGLVSRPARETHYRGHKRDHERVERRRARAVGEQRLRNLDRARAARSEA